MAAPVTFTVAVHTRSHCGSVTCFHFADDSCSHDRTWSGCQGRLLRKRNGVSQRVSRIITCLSLACVVAMHCPLDPRIAILSVRLRKNPLLSDFYGCTELGEGYGGYGNSYGATTAAAYELERDACSSKCTPTCRVLHNKTKRYPICDLPHDSLGWLPKNVMPQKHHKATNYFKRRWPKKPCLTMLKEKYMDAHAKSYQHYYCSRWVLIFNVYTILMRASLYP